MRFWTSSISPDIKMTLFLKTWMFTCYCRWAADPISWTPAHPHWRWRWWWRRFTRFIRRAGLQTNALNDGRWSLDAAAPEMKAMDGSRSPARDADRAEKLAECFGKRRELSDSIGNIIQRRSCSTATRPHEGAIYHINMIYWTSHHALKYSIVRCFSAGGSRRVLPKKQHQQQQKN